MTTASFLATAIFSLPFATFPFPDGREPEVVRGARDQAFRAGIVENAAHQGATGGRPSPAAASLGTRSISPMTSAGMHVGVDVSKENSDFSVLGSKGMKTVSDNAQGVRKIAAPARKNG